MVEEQDKSPARAGAPEESVPDVDSKLKAASQVLIAEMEELIRRAKTLQMEHEALLAERRKLKKLRQVVHSFK